MSSRGPPLAEPKPDAVSAPVQPATERLLRAERAFEAGDYRELARRLEGLSDAREPGVTERARELGRVLARDPLLLSVLVLCSLILSAMVVYYALP
jgi:hypothetical protein